MIVPEVMQITNEDRRKFRRIAYSAKKSRNPSCFMGPACVTDTIFHLFLSPYHFKLSPYFLKKNKHSLLIFHSHLYFHIGRIWKRHTRKMA